MADFDVSKYAHSPVHKALVLKDYSGLEKILAGLPRLRNPFELRNEAEAIAEEEKASTISAVLDYRDVPNRDTPLHLAAKLGDDKATEMLMVAGANKNLKNKQGWSALSEAIINKQEKVGLIMVKYSWNHIDEKYQRRLPRYVGTMQRMKDFYMEMTFHFESSVIPFISRIAPSDTYKIWKRGGNMRADMTLAGFDGMQFKRSDMSLFFLGDGSADGKKRPGTFCMLFHKKKEVISFIVVAKEPTETQIQERFNKKKGQVNTKKIKIDVTQAVLEPQLTWRRKERKEMVGPFKAKVYEMHNVSVVGKSIRAPGTRTDENKKENNNTNKEIQESNTTNKEIQDMLTEEERKQLEVALQQSMDLLESNNEDHKKGGKKEKKGRGHKEKENKKGKDNKASSADSGGSNTKDNNEERNDFEFKLGQGMRPVLWLSPDFPLEVEDLLPLLDILADKVKAVRRLRELLTTKLPKETFPVKVAIPVIPSVKVLISFTKFEELPPVDEFSSAPSSPTSDQENPEENQSQSQSQSQSRSSSWFKWIKAHPSSSSADPDEILDPFEIPSDYTWKEVN